MRYAKLSCTEFYPCYLQQCNSIDLFSCRTPGYGQKGHMNKVCTSFSSEVFMELALQFFLRTQYGVRAHVVLSMTELDFLKKIFYPENGENRTSRGFFERNRKFGVFSQFSIVLSVWSIMKVCITVIFVCLDKFHIWESSGS